VVNRGGEHDHDPSGPAVNTTSPTARKDQFLILSSHNRPSLSSPVSHQRYAQRHGYGYLFGGTPYPVASPYD